MAAILRHQKNVAERILIQLISDIDQLAEPGRSLARFVFRHTIALAEHLSLGGDPDAPAKQLLTRDEKGTN